MMVHIPTPKEIEEESRLGDLRRERIRQDNLVMKEKIAATNREAQVRIQKEFKRQCRAQADRAEELKERGLRLTENSPFKLDIYKQISGTAKMRVAREQRRAKVKNIGSTLNDMIGVPRNNPITEAVYMNQPDVKFQNALDVRKHRETLRTLVNEYRTCEQMSSEEMARIKSFFPEVAMEVEKNLNKGVVPRPSSKKKKKSKTVATG